MGKSQHEEEPARERSLKTLNSRASNSRNKPERNPAGTDLGTFSLLAGFHGAGRTSAAAGGEESSVDSPDGGPCISQHQPVRKEIPTSAMWCVGVG